MKCLGIEKLKTAYDILDQLTSEEVEVSGSHTAKKSRIESTQCELQLVVVEKTLACRVTTWFGWEDTGFKI